MNLGLDNKRVLITGSSRGIGLVIARGFLEEDANVILTSRNQADIDKQKNKLIKEFTQSNILAYACDFTVINSIASLKEKIQYEWKGLDILVINVGNGRSVNNPIPPAENFEKVFQLNFDSAVNTAREFYPFIKESLGNILFIASIAGMEAVGAPVDYSVAKSAVIAFSKNLARKAAIDGIRVNCIAPGNIYFESGTWDEKIKTNPGQIKKLIEATIPMNRFGKPEEIADATLFLCSKRASFITGVCLAVDGGQTVGIL